MPRSSRAGERKAEGLSALDPLVPQRRQKANLVLGLYRCSVPGSIRSWQHPCRRKLCEDQEQCEQHVAASSTGSCALRWIVSWSIKHDRTRLLRTPSGRYGALPGRDHRRLHGMRQRELPVFFQESHSDARFEMRRSVQRNLTGTGPRPCKIVYPGHWM